MTILQIINIAKYSQPLAMVAIEKGGLNGNGIDVLLPRKIYSVRKNVEWLYDLDPNDDTLTFTANYLYSICAPFNLKAAASITGGGSISPSSGGTTPSPYDFEVDANSFIPTGGSTVTIPEFIGYNLLFARGGITQSQVVLGGGSSFYSWNKITGLFTCFPAAAATEIFQLYPYV